MLFHIDEAKLMTKTSSSHYVQVHLGQSVLVLGTSEVRTGIAFGYGFGREDRRLRWRSIPAQLIHYIHYQRGSGDQSPEPADSFGYSAIARYRFPTNGSVGLYLDIGWGLQYTTPTTVDLDSLFNSTPYLGFGVAKRVPEGEFLLGLGWFHISNAGTKGDNHGQNYLHLTMGVRY